MEWDLDRLTEEWNTHKIKKSNYSLVSGIPGELHFFPKNQGNEHCGKNSTITEVNEVLKESNVHFDFQGI